MTAIAATLLADAFPENPAQAAQLAASRLDTDTDTIATMAAAIVAAARATPLASSVQDEDYIIYEAERLTRIADGRTSSVFPYPDLLRWEPPKSGLESVGTAEGRLALAGLGWIDF